MSEPLALVIFDVDGTLVDSQADILAAMTQAFDHAALTLPAREEVLAIVGLSLDEAMAQLAPAATPALRARMVQAYKDGYMQLRAQTGVEASSPLYPGARELIRQLQALPHVQLGIATGKSRRGLDKLLEGHGLDGVFTTQQVADHHPSKPHPSMILQAMSETGIDAARVVMVGDTEFDMQMARAAGVAGIAVEWGYHPLDRLGDAIHSISRFDALPGLLDKMWNVQ